MEKVILLDGAMGTMLQEAGLGLGERPEIYGMEHPDILANVHRKYIEAGSNVIYSNTFGANAHKLKGTGHSVKEVIEANIKIAKDVAGDLAKVALDIGPIGELMAPLGTMSFDEAYEIYREMVEVGENAGADLVIFETETDLYEVKAGVLAAKENTSLPVWVTMSFEKSGRTFTGTTVSSMACMLDSLKVDAMGINCSLGPVEIYPFVKEMKKWTDRPIIVKPNAGLPDPATGKYNLDAKTFGKQMEDFYKEGVYIMGGCCGTTPDYIKALKGIDYVNLTVNKQDTCKKNAICSSAKTVEFTGVNVIGERINPTGKKRFQQALLENDLNYIMSMAIDQAEAGADILDINVGLPGIDEADTMTKVVNAVQSVVDLPLQIDSSDPKAIEAGLRACNGRALVNSVNAEQSVLDSILPIVEKYGAAIVGLTMDKAGIPDKADKRFELASFITKEASKYGITKEDILIDCLTLTISAQQDQAMETLKAVRRVREELGTHAVLGVSNISFGLPKRNNITTSFLSQALFAGLDFPIVNPNSKEIMDAVVSFRALSGEDRQCEKYIERFADSEDAPVLKTAATMTVEAAILKGLKKETRDLTADLLDKMSELDVINTKLIPALDVVGEKYEKQQIFLPQLINAANAACEGFDLIKERIAKRGDASISKGKIILATVEGDIHDIGKNIVKVVLENYGYQVIDLGRDVPVEKVVEAAIREDVKLVGLSALMTTTVVSMKKTIEALRASGHKCKVMVGGAVLTKEYAMEIGADFYTKDAKESADVAKKILG